MYLFHLILTLNKCIKNLSTGDFADMKIYIIFLFMFTGMALEASENMSSKDSLTLHDTFQHNRMIKGIEKRQEEIKQNSKNELPSSYIQESEHKLLEGFLAKYPENLFLHYNLGIFWIFQDVQKTVKQLLFILKNKKSDELRFRSAFNLGTLYGYDRRLNIEDKNHIDQALKYYQIALEIKPDSLETRQNIEMLFLAKQSNKSQQGKGDSKQQKEKGRENKSDQKKQEDESEKDFSKNQDELGDDQGTSYKQNRRDKKEQKFQSKNLTKRDVQDILGELKQQEQQIWEKLVEEEAKKQNAKNQGRSRWMLDNILKNEVTKDQGLDKDW